MQILIIIYTINLLLLASINHKSPIELPHHYSSSLQCTPHVWMFVLMCYPIILHIQLRISPLINFLYFHWLIYLTQGLSLLNFRVPISYLITKSPLIQPIAKTLNSILHQILCLKPSSSSLLYRTYFSIIITLMTSHHHASVTCIIYP